ncbi:MFS transporter [Gryllotalpicola ginsengisoli]|uniref:MFS transporter n=1 Tax=Gryllotalpicola ginsengisoli TaxID=444608 RepID=UPI0003B760C6|nr:MFS transporter [Gryllotalpicola ginsengisoli]
MTDAPAGTGRFSWRFITPVLIGPVLNPINTSMIAVALVPISRDLHVATSVVVWLVAGLYLASAIAQPTMGKLADVFGPRRVYLVGLVVVLVAGILPNLWHTFPAVLVARILIGIGTSAAYPSAMALIRDQSIRLARQTPPALLSAISIAAQTTAAVGPVLGGLLIGAFGWESIFLVNIPLAAIALVLTIAGVPSDATRPERSGPKPRLKDVDPLGVALFAGALAALLVFLLDLSVANLWLVGLTVVLLGVLLWWSLRRTHPFIDVRMLRRNGALSRTYLRMLLIYFGAYTMMYGFSQWTQGSAGYSADQAGWLQLPTAVLAALTSVAVARNRRLKLPLVLSGAIPFLGGLLLMLLHASSPLWLLLLAAAIFGVPQGLASVSNQQALYRQAPGDQLGTASGLSRTAVYLGSILSSAAIGLAFPTAPTDGGLHALGLAIAVIVGLAALLALVDPALRSPKSERVGEGPAPE